MTEYVYARTICGILMRCRPEPDPESGLLLIPGGFSPMYDSRWEIADASGLPFQIGDVVTLSEEYAGAHRAGQATGPIVGIDPHWTEPHYLVDLGWNSGPPPFPAEDLRITQPV